MLSSGKPKIILKLKNILLITLFYDAVLSFVRTYDHFHIQSRQPISETTGIWAEL
jgi:hypothetical protein